MILVDANLLLYAKISGYPQHEAARTWLDDRINGPTLVGIPWASALAFLRISSNPRVFSAPLSVEQAWTHLQSWLSHPNVWSPTPTEGHADVLETLVRGQGLTPKLVTDCHLAALALSHGLTLCSSDRGFARFLALSWTNPLLSPLDR